MKVSKTFFLSTLIGGCGLVITLFLGTSVFGSSSNNENLNHSKDSKQMKTLHDFKSLTLDGAKYDFAQLEGKKVMIVNTASKCGLTPQYEQLQSLYDEYGGASFEIIGFPSNDFAGQEPGTADEIAEFCQKNYGVSFPMMEKVHVKEGELHPVYQWLTQKSENGVGDFEVKWNFHKFLIDQEGKLVRDLSPQTLPIDETVLSWLSE